MENTETEPAMIAESTPPEPRSTVVEKKPQNRLLWLLVVVLFAWIGVGGWFIYQQQDRQQHRLAELSSQLATEEQIKQQLTQLTTTLAGEKIARQQQIDALVEIDASLVSQINELAQAQPLTNHDVNQKWILSEIEFLVKTANQRVVLAGDVESAITALTLADQQLTELADPRLYKLRTLIAEDKLALASVRNVDIDGLVAKLHSSIASIDSLQVLTGSAISSESTDPDTKVSENWQAALSEVWQQIRSLVVIRHQQEGATAVLVPEQRYFLYQNLRLTLESARFALLSNNEPVFHTSLRTAEHWLQQYFVGSERDALLAEISDMQSEKITVTLPDISASLRWLQQQGHL